MYVSCRLYSVVGIKSNDLRRNAGETYDTKVRSQFVSGKINKNYTSEWIEMLKPSGIYHLSDALIEIEDMIGGDQGSGLKSGESIYKIAKDEGLCSIDLYRFVTGLILEGTTLYFTYARMRNWEIMKADQLLLKKRTVLNERMYNLHCGKCFDIN